MFEVMTTGVCHVESVGFLGHLQGVRDYVMCHESCVRCLWSC